MSEGTTQIRLNKVAREFNVGLSTIIEFLAKKGYKIESSPNTKISEEIYNILAKEYQTEKAEKERSKQIGRDITSHETVSVENTHKAEKDNRPEKENDDLLIIRGGMIEKELQPEHDKKAAPVAKSDVDQEEIIVKKEKEDKKSAPQTEEPQVKSKEDTHEEEKPVVKEKPAKVSSKTKKVTETTEIAEAEKSGEKETKVNVTETTETDIEHDGTSGVKVIGKIDLDSLNKKPSKKSKQKAEVKTEEEANVIVPAEVVVEQIVVTEETQAAVDSEIVKDKPASEDLKNVAVEDDNVSSDVHVAEELVEKVELSDIQDLVEQDKEEDVSETSTNNDNFIKTEYQKLKGLTFTGERIELPAEKPVAKKPVPVGSSSGKTKTKRKRIAETTKKAVDVNKPHPQKKEDRPSKSKGKGKRVEKGAKPDVVITDEEIQKQIRETLAKLTTTTKSKAAKYRRAKREMVSHQLEEEQLKIEKEKSILKVTEFVTANDLASMMDVPVSEVVKTCFNLGLVVSINQRLDAETLSIVADEFGFNVEFVSADVQEAIGESEEADKPEDLVPRAPIVTVMGHVDHGKTSLLDHIRKTNVIAGEAGGITQHIGAYEVVLENGKKITFLDTPGHEAFTAMRARGAKITDVAIIVIAADDAVMPQTKEAINHAMAAGVPMVFAINKVDKPNANAEKIKEELSAMNILVEDWGGKYQCQEISSKKGINVDLLLEKVLLEAELMELKGNPSKAASGTVIESSLDKGRGYIAKVLVQNGALKMGDMVLAGYHYGRVKAMLNERNQRIDYAGPSSPVLLLGLNGAPQAGDKFKVMTDEKETKIIAAKRLQLQREQGLRTQKHITLDEIGRRIAIGDFKELNVIVKGDVDGSVEALSDSILKLSTPEVQVNVIHQSVGAVTESDVLLASASNAIVVGFQVRPTQGARKIAEQEQIDIRLYSIIYNAINELKAAIEGMLSPEIEEKITGNLEIREVFRISKVGAVAGCLVLDGRITRSTNIRVIRDGIVVHTGQLSTLKRFKDDVKEVVSGYECGLSIASFNDIKVGDIIEGYEQVEIKRKL